MGNSEDFIQFCSNEITALARPTSSVTSCKKTWPTDAKHQLEKKGKVSFSQKVVLSVLQL